MPLNVYDLTRLRMGNYDITWATNLLGATDKVEPKIDMVTKPIQIGSIGDVELGEWIIALKGTIDVELREIDLGQFQKLLPWYVSGSIPLMPTTWHKDLYSYAAPLILHPTDLPTATTTQDLTLLKALPKFNVQKRDGASFEILNVSFKFWPDRAQLINQASPLQIYGYVGAAP
jgi:hypothetical protein